MVSQLFFLSFVSLALASPFKPQPPRPNIVISNDDGWATAQIRSIFNTYDATGRYNLVLSANAVDKSGTANTTAVAVPLLNATCEFDTCPIGAPSTGADAHDPRLNYVNAYPQDSINYAVTVLAPKLYQQPLDFASCGPNIGSNLGNTCLQISGTCHEAAQAARMGIAAVAFSSPKPPEAFVSYTTLQSDPNADSSIAANIYSQLSVRLSDTLLASAGYFNSHSVGNNKDILPPNVVVNVNFPTLDGCNRVEDFKYVFTRVLPATRGTRDVELCNNRGQLTDETTVFNTPGCFIAVSVFDVYTFNDVDASTQQIVADKLKPILSCLPSHK